MHKLLFAFLSVFFLFSCNSTGRQPEPTDENKPVKVMIPENSCFVSVIKQDTVWLKIEFFPNVVTGILKYNFSEKDDNAGSLEGKLMGNKIFADYTYTAEGKTTVREVAFLLDGNTVTEGFGDMKEENGKMIFKDKDKINFSGGLVFTGIDCVENDNKFRINP